MEIIAGKHGALGRRDGRERAAPALRSRHPAGLVEAGAASHAYSLAAYRRRDPRPRPVLPRRGAARPRSQRGCAGPGVPDGGKRSDREGLRGRPHHLRRAGRCLAARPAGRCRRGRGNGQALLAPHRRLEKSQARQLGGGLREAVQSDKSHVAVA